MLNKTVYLCGPINGCSDEECKLWREEVKGWGWNVLDPLRRDYRGKERGESRAIVELDKIDIEKSDIILVKHTKPSVGTTMEIFYGYLLQKFIVVVTREQNISPWLEYHADLIVASLEEAKKVIEHIYENEKRIF